MRTSWPSLKRALLKPATASPSPPVWARGVHSEVMKRMRLLEEPDAATAGALILAVFFLGLGVFLTGAGEAAALTGTGGGSGALAAALALRETFGAEDCAANGMLAGDFLSGEDLAMVGG